MADAGVTPSTYNARIVALRCFFGVPCGRDEVKRFMQFRREPRKLPIVLSIEEISALLAAAPGPGLKYRAALSIGYGGCLRVSEVTHLKVRDIVPEARLRHDSDRDIVPEARLRHDSDRDIVPEARLRHDSDRDIVPEARLRHDSDRDIVPEARLRHDSDRMLIHVEHPLGTLLRNTLPGSLAKAARIAT